MNCVTLKYSSLVAVVDMTCSEDLVQESNLARVKIDRCLRQYTFEVISKTSIIAQRTVTREA